MIRYGTIHINDNCIIGMHSVIMTNITIDPNAIIGAGCVVIKIVPEGCVYARVLAHFISWTEEYAEKCLIETPFYDSLCTSLTKRSVFSKLGCPI